MSHDTYAFFHLLTLSTWPWPWYLLRIRPLLIVSLLHPLGRLSENFGFVTGICPVSVADKAKVTILPSACLDFNSGLLKVSSLKSSCWNLSTSASPPRNGHSFGVRQGAGGGVESAPPPLVVRVLPNTPAWRGLCGPSHPWSGLMTADRCCSDRLVCVRQHDPPLQISDLIEDLKDSTKLLALLTVLSGQQLVRSLSARPLLPDCNVGIGSSTPGSQELVRYSLLAHSGAVERLYLHWAQTGTVPVHVFNPIELSCRLIRVHRGEYLPLLGTAVEC